MTIATSPTAVASDAGSLGGATVMGASLDSGAGILAVTGAGPGTLLLALAGLASVLAGAAAMVTGRQIAPRNTATANLPDLSHRATVS